VDPEIPDKLYFRIGEVAKLAGIKPYVLRFWESEFSGLGPKKSGTGQRLYRRKDVELVLEIKRLLYEERFTIEGARKILESRRRAGPPPDPAAIYSEIRRGLNEILSILEHSGNGG
jgi:DNA-binding transcriptional MerR regulator